MIHKEVLSPKRAATRAAGVCIRHLPQHPRSRCGRRASSGMSPGSVLEMQPPGPSPGLPNQLLQRREVPTENRDGIQAKPRLGKTSGNVMKWRRSSGSLGGRTIRARAVTQKDDSSPWGPAALGYACFSVSSFLRPSESGPPDHWHFPRCGSRRLPPMARPSV